MKNCRSDLVSVIVPVYNVEQYLSQCIESIIAQTYTNLEIILVDDGSTDGCPQICDKYAARDARIRVIHKPNGGLSDARNAGLDIARGKYIGFIDSDDFIHPLMYERLYNALTESDADIAMCNSILVDEEGISIEFSNKLLPDYESTGMEILRTMYEVGKFNVHYIVVWNKIYARKLWNNLRFPSGIIHEDEYIVHHILGDCKKIVSISDQLYYYRKTPGSLMNKPYDIKRFDIFYALSDRAKYFLSLNLPKETGNVLSNYFETLRTKYFLIQKSNDTKDKLIEVRKNARKLLMTYIKTSSDIWTVKIANIIFLYTPALYKMIWHKKQPK